MEYYVSHRVNYEPSGHKDFPNKYFKTLEEAQEYFNKQRELCKKKAEKSIKEFPDLYSSKSMRDDLFSDISEEFLDDFCGFKEHAEFQFHENYSYHYWTLCSDDL